MNVTNGGVLSFRDEGPSKGDMLGPVAEAVLFRKVTWEPSCLTQRIAACPAAPVRAPQNITLIGGYR